MYELIDGLRDEFKTQDLERILHVIGKGICLLSIPMSETTRSLLEVVTFCASGMSVVLPYPELGFYGQPNLFYEAIRVSSKAKSDYQRCYGKDHSQRQKHDTGPGDEVNQVKPQKRMAERSARRT